MAEAEDEMDEAIIEALTNLATSTTSDHISITALIEADSCLAKQLEDRSYDLKAIIELLKKECRGCRSFTPQS
jgi:hypothetical protein